MRIPPRLLINAALMLVACQHAVRREDSRQSAIAQQFADTLVGVVRYTSARAFDLEKPGTRDSLRAMLRAQRARWQAARPAAYRFLLRVQCFCPGQRGWVLLESRAGQPLRAWDRSGKPIGLVDWNTFDVDAFYDNLTRTVETMASAQVAFDARWHFPAYVGASASSRLPDTWSIIEIRGFRPL